MDDGPADDVAAVVMVGMVVALGWLAYALAEAWFVHATAVPC